MHNCTVLIVSVLMHGLFGDANGISYYIASNSMLGLERNGKGRSIHQKGTRKTSSGREVLVQVTSRKQVSRVSPLLHAGGVTGCIQERQN